MSGPGQNEVLSGPVRTLRRSTAEWDQGQGNVGRLFGNVSIVTFSADGQVQHGGECPFHPRRFSPARWARLYGRRRTGHRSRSHGMDDGAPKTTQFSIPTDAQGKTHRGRGRWLRTVVGEKAETATSASRAAQNGKPSCLAALQNDNTDRLLRVRRARNRRTEPLELRTLLRSPYDYTSLPAEAEVSTMQTGGAGPPHCVSRDAEGTRADTRSCQ